MRVRGWVRVRGAGSGSSKRSVQQWQGKGKASAGELESLEKLDKSSRFISFLIFNYLEPPAITRQNPLGNVTGCSGGWPGNRCLSADVTPDSALMRWHFWSIRIHICFFWPLLLLSFLFNNDESNLNCCSRFDCCCCRFS